MQIIQSIQNRIHEIGGERVMLDFDLTALYETPTKVFNQSVKRNTKRFAKDFMLQLKADEWLLFRSKFAATTSQVINIQTNKGSRIEPFNTVKRSRYLPYAFNEEGVVTLRRILNSDRVIQMNIANRQAFVKTRKILLQQSDSKEQVKELKERVGGHDVQLSQIHDALENLLDEKANGRERISFKSKKLN